MTDFRKVGAHSIAIREAIRRSIYKVEGAGNREGCQTLQTADAGENPPLYRIRAAFSRFDTASTRLAFSESFTVV
jgi:hypothetical protein